MLMVKPATVEYNDVEYTLELGKIDSTHIGMEDHGIFSVNVNFDFGGSHQGTGHYAVADGPYLRTFIEAFLDLTNVDSWESLRGKDLFVLRTKPRGMIDGIMDKIQMKAVIFKELFDDED